MKRLLIHLIALSAIIAAGAETPRVSLKAEYDEIHNYRNSKTGTPIQNRSKFILLLADGTSQYYNPQTFFVDSLQNDPTGKATIGALWKEAYEEMMRSGKEPFYYIKERGFMQESRYRCEKDFNSGIITVRNSSGGDRYRYPVEMADLTWEIGDSTKTVLGYECIQAGANYHGRHWTAWFAPEIPFHDGPWQLCGLPGLIMEVRTDDDAFAFVITGLQQTSETFKPNFDEAKYYDTKRKSYWKMVDYSRRNRSAQIGAMTGGAVTLSDDINYKGGLDYIEIDFEE